VPRRTLKPKLPPGRVERAYKYRLYPTREQIDAIEEQLSFGCYLYNSALQQRREAYEKGKILFYNDQSADLTDAKKDGIFPAEMNAWTLQKVLWRLDRAYRETIERIERGEKTGFPRYKTGWKFRSLDWTFQGKAGGARLVHPGYEWHRGPWTKAEKAALAACPPDKLRLFLGGIGAIKVKWHRLFPEGAELKTCTVTRKNHKYYVRFIIETDEQPLPKTGRTVGIDVGVRTFVATSDGLILGGTIDATTGKASKRKTSTDQAQKRIARSQRVASRRKPGSERRRKANLIAYRQMEKVARERLDNAHKASRMLVDNYDAITHESLNLKAMIRIRGGKYTLDAGIGPLLRFLTYKASSAGRTVTVVDPRNTSRTCHECGNVDAGNRCLDTFRCIACGHEDHADINAAKNIARLGASLRGEGLKSGPSVKREAAVATATGGVPASIGPLGEAWRHNHDSWT